MKVGREEHGDDAEPPHAEAVLCTYSVKSQPTDM